MPPEACSTALLAGEPYVITHGDLVPAVDTRSALLRNAAEAARLT